MFFCGDAPLTSSAAQRKLKPIGVLVLCISGETGASQHGLADLVSGLRFGDQSSRAELARLLDKPVKCLRGVALSALRRGDAVADLDPAGIVRRAVKTDAPDDQPRAAGFCCAISVAR